MMLIVIHISLACLGLAEAALSLVRPSRVLIRSSLATLTLTLGTGSLLVWLQHASLAGACGSGLSYTVLMLGAATFARRHVVATDN